MNEVRKSEFAGAMPDFGGPFVQASSDATRRLCEQGQSVAKTISEWNNEVSHFLTNRAAPEWRGNRAHDEVPRTCWMPSLFKLNGFGMLLTTT